MKTERELPKFKPYVVELRSARDGKERATLSYFECTACGEFGPRDEVTQLCRPCWRIVVLGGLK